MKTTAIIANMSGPTAALAGVQTWFIPGLNVQNLSRAINQTDANVGASTFLTTATADGKSLPNALLVFGLISSTQIDFTKVGSIFQTVNPVEAPFELQFWSVDGAGNKLNNYLYPVVIARCLDTATVTLNQAGTGMIMPIVRDLGYTDALVGDVNAIADILDRRYNTNGVVLDASVITAIENGTRNFTVDRSGRLVNVMRSTSVATATATSNAVPAEHRTLVAAIGTGLFGGYSAVLGLAPYNPTVITGSDAKHVLAFRAAQLVKLGVLLFAAYTVYHRVRYGHWAPLPKYLQPAANRLSHVAASHANAAVARIPAAAIAPRHVVPVPGHKAQARSVHASQQMRLARR